MEPITPFDWQRLFLGVAPPLYFLEIAVRVILIYAFAIVMLRLMGKRGKRQMSAFELVLVIALGSATGDAMLYPEGPILYAWLIITIMVGLDRLLSELQYRHKNINAFLSGPPRLLVRNGETLEESLRKENLREGEVLALLREQKIADTSEVGYAFLEQTGNLGIIGREKMGQARSGESTLPEEFGE